MEIVQKENITLGVSSNPHQFEDIDSSDDDSIFYDSYQFDDDDMESSDDDSTRSASKRTSKILDGSESPDEKVKKSMSKRKLAPMSTSTDDDGNPAGSEKKNVASEEDYRAKNVKRYSPVKDQSLNIKERHTKRGKDIKDASIEGKKMKYSHGIRRGSEEPNREMELQRSYSADREGSDGASGIKELKLAENTNTEKEMKDDKKIRSAREQLRRQLYRKNRDSRDSEKTGIQLYRKNRDSKGDDGTTTEKEFRWEDEIKREKEHRDEDEIQSAREPRDEVQSMKEHQAEDGNKQRDEGGDQSARRHQEDEMLSAREHRDEGEVRTSRGHRDEEYGRKKEVGEPRYMIRDKRRHVDYGYARDKYEERPRRSFVESYHDGDRSEGKQRHHSWHPHRGQSDMDVRPYRGEGERYSHVDRRSEGDWYLVRPRGERLQIKPCDYFNSFGFCRHKSGHKSKSGTRCILHICRRCFYTQRAKEYHSERDCHLKD